ncbi:hypothetical protein LCGC14_0603960 [marine sediment metagenome]|uniref:Glycosyltransferase 2-like domain-containing protein n=1 Tax=marine sediment metagenome TaxID=412755 RepID=A0A0F9TVY2_9ZZZZ
MRRLLSIDTDAKFFPLFQAALKSFLKYNPDWDVEILDIGMTNAQRREMTNVGNVVMLNCDNDVRWPGVFSRLRYFRDNATRADLVLHLDADTLTFGSIESLVRQFLGTGADIALSDSSYLIGRFIRSHRIARQAFKHFDSWKDLPGSNTGVSLSTASMFAAIAKRALNLVDKFAGLFVFGEQEVMNAVIYDDGLKRLRMLQIYNFRLANSKQTPAVLIEPPLTTDRQRTVIAHLAMYKWAVFAGDGPYRYVGRWWSNIVERYEGKPWPTHASQ